MNNTKADKSELINKRRVYGRRQGRPLNTSRNTVLENLLPQLQINRDSLTEKADLQPEAIFNTPITGKLHFEIGFGNGEHLKYIMQQRPDDFFIGAEPFINGMAAFLKDIQTMPHDNVRVLMDDALIVLNSLPDACLDTIYILNPDPWPKSRHHKRRIVREDTLPVFSRTLKCGGQLIETTDLDDLAEWMLTQTINHPDFEWQAEREKDWKTPPAGWMPTRYETKGKNAERTQSYLLFQRKHRKP